MLDEINYGGKRTAAAAGGGLAERALWLNTATNTYYLRDFFIVGGRGERIILNSIGGGSLFIVWRPLPTCWSVNTLLCYLYPPLSSHQFSFHSTSSHTHTQLGEGAFSVVIEATKKSTGESFAVKVVTKSKLTKEDEVALKDEITVLKELQHEHIIRLYDVFEERSYWYLVTEQMKGGELFDRWVVMNMSGVSVAERVIDGQGSRAEPMILCYCYERSEWFMGSCIMHIDSCIISHMGGESVDGICVWLFIFLPKLCC